MRIATWNVDRGRAGGKGFCDILEVVRDIGADIWILTEAPVSVDIPSTVAFRSMPESPNGEGNDVWTAVHVSTSARANRCALSSHPLTAAVEVDLGPQRLLIYGSVLPWGTAAPYLPTGVGGHHAGTALFLHVLKQQVREIEMVRMHRPDRHLVFAGDFNQALDGPLSGGSRDGQVALRSALGRLRLVAATADQPHSLPGMKSIDHICVPSSWVVRAVTTIQPRNSAGRPISDHACYVVDL
ncbi:MAG TPA: endonuclease/exonuclease/phosphatase family protein [Candidatus Dormibacteraeota bacterium]